MQCEHARDPAMEEEVCRVRPIGDPEEKIVAAGEEDDERKQRVPNVSCAITYVCQELFSGREIPWVGL